MLAIFQLVQDPHKMSDVSFNDTFKDHQCNRMYKKWFDVRKLVSGDKHSIIAKGTYYPDYYQGYCDGKGKYTSIP